MSFNSNGVTENDAEFYNSPKKSHHIIPGCTVLWSFRSLFVFFS